MPVELTREALIERFTGLIEEQKVGFTLTDPSAPLDLDSFTMMLILTAASEMSVDLDMEHLDFDDFYSLDVLVDKVLAEAKTAI